MFPESKVTEIYCMEMCIRDRGKRGEQTEIP